MVWVMKDGKQEILGSELYTIHVDPTCPVRLLGGRVGGSSSMTPQLYRNAKLKLNILPPRARGHTFWKNHIVAPHIAAIARTASHTSPYVLKYRLHYNLNKMKMENSLSLF